MERENGTGKHARQPEGPAGKRTTARGDNPGRQGGDSGERAVTGQGEPLRIACTTGTHGAHERPCEPSLCLRLEW
jgi:hypothetical protein